MENGRELHVIMPKAKKKYKKEVWGMVELIHRFELATRNIFCMFVKWKMFMLSIS